MFEKSPSFSFSEQDWTSGVTPFEPRVKICLLHRNTVSGWQGGDWTLAMLCVCLLCDTLLLPPQPFLYSGHKANPSVL